MPPAPQRRPPKGAPSSEADVSALGGAAALAVFRSPAAERLEALQREHERLLKEIKKRKAACEVSEQSARDAVTAFQVKVSPLRESFVTLLGEIQKVFRELLGPGSRLNRRDKARVRRLYEHVLPDFDLESDEPARASGADFDPGHAHARGARESEIPRDAPDAGYSAAKPASKDSGLLKAVFRRLAIALHPDKVQDPVERETLTQVMKDVTRAYEAQDLARLVELERAWLCSDEPAAEDDGLERRTAQLMQANKELRRQLRTLTANLKDLKESARGFGVAPPRRGRGRREESEVEQMIASLEHDVGNLRKLRDFALSFQQGQIGLAEFLAGPALGAEEAGDELEQMLTDLFETMLSERDEGRGKPRRRRR